MSNVVKLRKKKPPTFGEVARVSVTERAFEENPLSVACGASSPKGRAFHNFLTK